MVIHQLMILFFHTAEIWGVPSILQLHKRDKFVVCLSAGLFLSSFCPLLVLASQYVLHGTSLAPYNEPFITLAFGENPSRLVKVLLFTADTYILTTTVVNILILLCVVMADASMGCTFFVQALR